MATVWDAEDAALADPERGWRERCEQAEARIAALEAALASEKERNTARADGMDRAATIERAPR